MNKIKNDQPKRRWAKWQDHHKWRGRFARRRSPIILFALFIVALYLMWYFSRVGITP